MFNEYVFAVITALLIKGQVNNHWLEWVIKAIPIIVKKCNSWTRYRKSVFIYFSLIETVWKKKKWNVGRDLKFKSSHPFGAYKFRSINYDWNNDEKKTTTKKRGNVFERRDAGRRWRRSTETADDAASGEELAMTASPK